MPMTGAVKDFVGHSVFASGLHGALLRNAAVVVVFHHIRDGAESDSLSIDVDMFERYCRFFRQHFRVVSLPDLTMKLERRERLHRELAITFDDGYLDNYENAAPILEKYKLPATFFVVTDWMGSSVVPWWDRDRGVCPQWMTWDHVRGLHRRGFDIGGHTQTHADLGTVSGDAALREILGARAELASRLGSSVPSFAYPYGGRHNVTEANRTLIRDAGFRCCCSGFGGHNVPTTNPFHINRVAISSWYTSPHQFGFEVTMRMSQLSA
jgi:peptidoglycan/xylan/chitin deacetylase (PgdA/CDA1 family)